MSDIDDSQVPEGDGSNSPLFEPEGSPPPYEQVVPQEPVLVIFTSVA